MTLERAHVMSRMRGDCDNCGEPMMAHCQRHVIPCCPRYPQHEQAAEAADREAADPERKAGSSDSAAVAPPTSSAEVGGSLDVEAVEEAFRTTAGFVERDQVNGHVYGFHLDRPEDFPLAAQAFAAAYKKALDAR